MEQDEQEQIEQMEEQEKMEQDEQEQIEQQEQEQTEQQEQEQIEQQEQEQVANREVATHRVGVKVNAYFRIKTASKFENRSLVPRPPPFFVLWFAFSIIHGSAPNEATKIAYSARKSKGYSKPGSRLSWTAAPAQAITFTLI